MKGKLYLLVSALLFSHFIFSQHYTPNSSGQSGTGANIDVVYHRANWTIDPNSATKTITGSITTYFKTLIANVNQITFDLRTSSFPASAVTATYHGSACTDASVSNILTITLPSTIAAANTLDSVVINYTGIPPGVSGAAQGYQAGGTGTNKFISTLSESYEDKDWWPCKADMKDKIDSMDMNFTVPWNTATGDTFWVAANGLLVDSSMINATTRNFSFKTRYPIASYLVGIAVGKYNRYYRNLNINGTNMQVAYYLLKNTASQAAKVTLMDNVNQVVVAFSNKFGDYPFKLEKHGFYDGLAGAGGMEHQTFSAMLSSQYNVGTLVHELMHQWFGDNVTFATWNDLWLAEGFARYSEALCGELVPSLGVNPYTVRNGFKTSALGLNAQSTWIPNSNMGTSALIWSSNYGSTVYERGAVVVSMLRAIAGDAKFFEACTNYQTSLKGKAATTDSLKNHFNTVLGQDISEFFNDYVGGSGSATTAVGGVGNPINTVNWNNPGTNKLVLSMGAQTRTAGSNVTYFNGPVVVHATNAASGWTKDTTIVFYDWGNGILSKAGNGLGAPYGHILSYPLSFTPTNLFYDDSARTMSTGSTTKLTVLASNDISFSARKTLVGNESILSLETTDVITKVELEKSTNGVDFTTAGEMKLNSTINQLNTYKLVDGNIYEPTVFYRAKIYYSNKEEFTNIIKIEGGDKQGISIVPNPAKDMVTISFANPLNDDVLVQIVDASGSVIKEAITKSNTTKLNVSNLTSGIYVVQIIKQGQITESNKLLIKH